METIIKNGMKECGMKIKFTGFIAISKYMIKRYGLNEAMARVIKKKKNGSTKRK